jgi:phosphatidate cytidylyltransferase
MLGIVWVGSAFAHAVLLREAEHGGGIVALVVVATFAGDTGAYFAGRALGRRPLAPRISPNKTVEGFVGGLLAAILGAEAVGLYQDWLSGWEALALGAAIGLIGPLGDLFESYLKRDRGVKDAGHVFGAHGGALDRLDGILFTAVAGYYVWLALL